MATPNYSQILDDIRKQSNALKSPCIITGIGYNDSWVPLQNGRPVATKPSTSENVPRGSQVIWTSEMKLNYRCIHGRETQKTFVGQGQNKKVSRAKTCRAVVEWWVTSHPQADKITNQEVEDLISKQKLADPILASKSKRKKKKGGRRGQSNPRNPFSNPAEGLTLEMAKYLLDRAVDIRALCYHYGVNLKLNAEAPLTTPAVWNVSLTLPDATGQLDVLGTGSGETDTAALAAAERVINKNRLAEHLFRLIPPPSTGAETLVETVQRTVTSDPDEFAKWLSHFSQDQIAYCTSPDPSTGPGEHLHGTWVIGIDIESSRANKTLGTIQVAVDGAVVIYSFHGSQWPAYTEGAIINYAERLPPVFVNMLQCPKIYKLLGGSFAERMLQEKITNNLQGLVRVGNIASKLGYTKRATPTKLAVGLTGLQSKKRNLTDFNWSTYPLSDEMIATATADVILTFQIGAALSRRLRALESLSADDDGKEGKEGDSKLDWINCSSITSVTPLDLPVTLPRPTIASITIPPPPPPATSRPPPPPSGRRNGLDGKRGPPRERRVRRRDPLDDFDDYEFRRRRREPPSGFRGGPPPQRGPYAEPYGREGGGGGWRSIEVNPFAKPPPEPEVIHLPRLVPGQPMPYIDSYRRQQPPSQVKVEPAPLPPPIEPPRSSASYYQSISTFPSSAPRSRPASPPPPEPPRGPAPYPPYGPGPSRYPPSPPRASRYLPPPPPPNYPPPPSRYGSGFRGYTRY